MRSLLFLFFVSFTFTLILPTTASTQETGQADKAQLRSQLEAQRDQLRGEVVALANLLSSDNINGEENKGISVLNDQLQEKIKSLAAVEQRLLNLKFQDIASNWQEMQNELSQSLTKAGVSAQQQWADYQKRLEDSRQALVKIWSN